jgi:hypothetical protein
MEPSSGDAEELLRRSRPRPRPEFVRELEASLLRSVEPRRARASLWPSWFAPRRLVAVSGVGAALAAILVVLSIAGALPLTVGGADDAAADRNCVTVTRWKLERRPIMKVGPDQKMHVTSDTRLVPRRVVRCH